MKQIKLLLFFFKKKKKRICLVVQGMWVRSLVRELRFHMLQGN